LDDGPHDRLPPNARCLFHPSVNDNTRKHVGNIFKCFGARPGVHYVTAQRLVDVGEKITQASGLGSAIVLASVDGAAHALEFVRAQTPEHPVGLLVLGLPYQLMELHRTIPDEPNVQFVLKPVKPSDLLKAVTKLASKGGANEKVLSSNSEWLHDSIASGDHNELQERLEAAGVNAAVNTVENLGRTSMDSAEIDAAVDSERRRVEKDKRRDSSVSRSSSEKPDGADTVGGSNSANNTNLTTSRAHTAPKKDSPGDLAGMSVLLVEDNLMNQQMAKYSIVKAGADINIANHGKEAVEMVIERLNAGLGNYDCILMDMMMPVMDGAEATVKIREFEKTFYAKTENLEKRRKAHVIVGLSANVGPEYTAKVKEAGMNGSMSKPFYPATLRNTLQQVLHKTYQGFKRASGDADTSIGSKPGN